MKIGWLFNYAHAHGIKEKDLRLFGRILHELHLVKLIDVDHWTYKHLKEQEKE